MQFYFLIYSDLPFLKEHIPFESLCDCSNYT